MKHTIHVKWLEQNQMKMIRLQIQAPDITSGQEKAEQLLSATAQEYQLNTVQGHIERQGNKIRLITPNIRVQVQIVLTKQLGTI